MLEHTNGSPTSVASHETATDGTKCETENADRSYNDAGRKRLNGWALRTRSGNDRGRAAGDQSEMAL
ncbi:hypothetical protein SAMD00023353_6100140 [Rosellinia necatrix]|uniref:Uncharacterized protein n=1 Tax=Rosellinia necatrix TaxID=77044 RepID=A0A1S8AA80_ROSNE|nr:hypothetical protein SAMD00023353_6100140 [Rosellinia necatrix]